MEVLISKVDVIEQSQDTEQTQDAPDEFSDVFRSHYPQVVRHMMSIVREQTIAEELAQEVFVKLYSIDRTQIENLPAWLAKVSMNTACNHFRSEKRRRARDEKASDLEDTLIPSSEERWFQQEEIAAVRETLVDLEERDRTLLLMKYSGFHYTELAEAVGVERNSVGTLLARAKKKFRKLYQRRRGSEV